MSIKSKCLSALFALICSAAPCLAANPDFDPNVILNVDLMLVEIPSAQIPPAARLSAKDVLLLAADSEKSRVLARHSAPVKNGENHKISSGGVRYIQSANTRDGYENRNNFEYTPFKKTNSDKITLELRAIIDWFVQEGDILTMPDMNSFTISTICAAKPGQPTIASSMMGSNGMLYLIATIDEAKP